MTKKLTCLDCVAELSKNAPELDGTETARHINSRRPAPYPGPRCATHYRVFQKVAHA